MIIDIDGISAVGKTSLIRSLTLNEKFWSLPEILEKNKPPYKNITTEKEFWVKQQWFLENAFERYNLARKIEKEFILIDLGLMDILTHSIIYPKVIDQKWNVEKILLKFLKLHYPYWEHVCIYLKASKLTLEDRKEYDAISFRKHHKQNLQMMNFKDLFYENAMKQYPNNFFVINTNNLSLFEVENICKPLFEKIPNKIEIETLIKSLI